MSISSFNSQRQEFQIIQTCEQHKSNIIGGAYIGKLYEGKSRFYCDECLEDDEANWAKQDKIHRVKIAFKNITNYKQGEASQDEPRLEQLLPLDKQIKYNCRELLKTYQATEEEQIEKNNKYFETLKEQINANVELVRQKALDYYQEIRQLGFTLKDHYENIIDCSQLKEIITSSDEKDVLNKNLREFIHKRLETAQNNKELNEQQNKFNRTNQLYTEESFDAFRKIIINQAKMITFDSTQEQSIKSFSAELSSAQRFLNAKSTKTQFTNIENSTYNFKPISDRAEVLEVSQPDSISFAKFTLPLDNRTNYQFVFEIHSLIPQPKDSSYVNLSVGNKDSLKEMPFTKYFGNSNNNQAQAGCSFVQQGQNLSKLTQQTTVVTLNLFIRKNQFYFTDNNRQSKNIMAKRQVFNQESQYNLYVSSQGEFKITLLHFDAQQQ